MTDYARSAAMAVRLIGRSGQSGAIRRTVATGGTAYAPSGFQPTDHAARFVLTGFKAHEVDGARVRADDVKALVSPALDIEPKTSDLLVRADGVTLSIVEAEAVKPAGTVVLWKLVCRR